MITIVASSASGLGYVFTSGIFNAITQPQNFGCYYIINAMLSGAVAISAASNQIEVWQAFIISLFGMVWYALGSKLMIKLEIDDPQEAFLIFGVQGFWGVLAVGLFNRGENLLSADGAQQLLIQFLGSMALIAWTIIISLAFFAILKKQKRFRVGNMYEVVGLDHMTRKSDFDDLLEVENIQKIETKQRCDMDTRKKTFKI